MADEPIDPALQIRLDVIAARQAAMRALTPKAQMIKVNPRDDDVRKALKHLPTGIKFPKDGPAEWPLDMFTHRRLSDGSVTRADEGGRTAQSLPRQAHQQHRG
jgi:hypothetical protein